ncbi:MAG TPA: AAA family ATPase [Pirellulaceae bacterium]|nr:AAA family ATPase [Pirellulaceae bacterium]
MRIKDILIDGFGVWKGLKIEELPEGVTVFFGPNEAGKTTVMQFVRTVLYGFSAERRTRYLPPVNGGTPGGRLRVDAGGADFTLERSGPAADVSDDVGRLNVLDGQDKPRDEAHLGLLLAGVDEPTFNNVFACGLREIQELSTLDDTTAAELLYKLTTGLDRVSIIDVIRDLAKARESLLSTSDQPSQIPQLTARRQQLTDQLASLSASSRRYGELAVQRGALADEAAELEQALERTDAHHRLLKAALDIQPLWNARAEIDKRLEALRDIPQLPERAVERMHSLRRRVIREKRRLKRIAAERKRLKAHAHGLETNKQVLNHATRIDALGDQAQWLTTLDGQIKKLRAEIQRLDDEIQQQLGGIQGKTSPEELSQDAFAALRRPGMLLREQSEQLDRAKQELEAAQSDFEHLSGKFTTAARGRRAEDLQQSLSEAGQNVALLRRRLQIEERLDELARRREELEFAGDEMQEFDGLPLRYTVALGMVFSLGVMLLLIGLVGGWNGWFASSMPYWLFGVLFAGGSALTKLFLERRTDDKQSDNTRHREHVRVQLADIKKERDEIDAVLPPGGGALDARVREAESELREIERLMPLLGDRTAAEEKVKASARKLETAQEAFKSARGRWREALKAVGLPEDFAPQKVRHVVRRGDAVVEMRRRREIRRDELEQREREMLAMAARIGQLMADCRLTPKLSDPQEQLRQLTQTLAQEKEILALKENTLRAARKLRAGRSRSVHLIRQALRRRSALLALAGVGDMVAFRQVASDTAKAHELRHGRDSTTEKIAGDLAGRYTEEEISVVMVSEGPDLQSRWDQRGTHVQELRTRIATLHERRGACTHEMQQLAADRRLAVTQWELASVEEQLRQSRRRWQVLSVIGQVLDVVRRKYETERQPETLQKASVYLKELTQGQYVRVWMPLDRRALLAEDELGRSLPLEVLSRGTHEAIYISLRLALASSFARRGALLPLVFDDVLVNLDRSRTQAAARVFKEFAADGRQILMFTCHEHIVEIFREAQVEVRMIPTRNQRPAAEPEKPKRKRKELAKTPVVELPPPPPPPVVPEIEPAEPRYAADPNSLFMQAGLEDGYDPTNAYELARPAKPARKRAVAMPPPPPPRYQIVTNYRLPETWPLAQTPQPLPPAAPPPPQYAPPPPAPPAATSPPMTAPKVVISQRRQRFTWESPEMYWEEQHVEDDKGAAPQTVPSPHFPVVSAKPAASRDIDVAEYPQGWHF